jgi:hypothetical protein
VCLVVNEEAQVQQDSPNSAQKPNASAKQSPKFWHGQLPNERLYNPKKIKNTEMAKGMHYIYPKLIC